MSAPQEPEGFKRWVPNELGEAAGSVDEQINRIVAMETRSLVHSARRMFVKTTFNSNPIVAHEWKMIVRALVDSER